MTDINNLLVQTPPNDVGLQRLELGGQRDKSFYQLLSSPDPKVTIDYSNKPSIEHPKWTKFQELVNENHDLIVREGNTIDTEIPISPPESNPQDNVFDFYFTPENLESVVTILNRIETGQIITDEDVLVFERLLATWQMSDSLSISEESWSFDIVIPLTAIATGLLSQISHGESLSVIGESISHQLNRPGTMGNKIKTIELNEIDRNQNHKQARFLLLSHTDQKVAFSASKAQQNAKIATGLQYLNTGTYLNHELLDRKYTFLTNKDGVSLWIRDYKTTAHSIEQQLEKLKEKAGHNESITQISYNGKIIYSRERVNNGS